MDYSVFVSYNKSIFILVYIDNLLIIGKNLNIINNLKNNLSKRFCIANFRLISYYLGMFITQTKNFINLDQKSYLEKVLL